MSAEERREDLPGALQIPAEPIQYLVGLQMIGGLWSNGETSIRSVTSSYRASTIFS